MVPVEIEKNIYLVGDSAMTDSRDCSVYLLNLESELALIDTGAGASVDMIVRNIEEAGFDPGRLSTIILTHCHIDHVGGASELRKRYNSRIFMHALDAAVLERGDNTMTAACWYGMHFEPLSVDVKFDTKEERFNIGGLEIVCIHTPGHSPGSISVYLDTGAKRVLFGQDIHGPFLPEFGADISHWQRSMKDLLALKADVLCEGHFGIFRPNEKVTEYIERYLEEYGE